MDLPKAIRIQLRTADLRDGIWTLRLWNTKQELRPLVLDYWFLCATVINILAWRIQWGKAWHIYSLEAAGHRGQMDTTSIDIRWTRVTEQWLMGVLSAMESWVRNLHFHCLLVGSRIGAQITLVISCYRREVDEDCALLRCYAASNGNFLQTFRDNLSSTIFRGQESKSPWRWDG
jgi:hypothetical protein